MPDEPSIGGDDAVDTLGRARDAAAAPPTGSLTAWSPPTAAPGTTSAEPGGDAG